MDSILISMYTNMIKSALSTIQLLNESEYKLYRLTLFLQKWTMIKESLQETFTEIHEQNQITLISIFYIFPRSWTFISFIYVISLMYF